MAIKGRDVVSTEPEVVFLGNIDKVLAPIYNHSNLHLMYWLRFKKNKSVEKEWVGEFQEKDINAERQW